MASSPVTTSVVESSSTSQLISGSPINGSSSEHHHYERDFLKGCSCADLAECLLERFGGNQAKTIEFFKQCQVQVEKKDPAATTSSSSSSSSDATLSEHNKVDLGPALLSKPVVLSMISPRGKVQLNFHHNHLVAVDTKTSHEAWRLGANQIAQIVIFPKPEDCKKPLAKKTSDVVLLHLSEPLTVKSQKKPVSQVSFTLPTELPEWKTQQPSSHEDLTVAWNQVFQCCFPGTKMIRVHHPETAPSAAFRSFQADRVSTTTGGMPYVTCYHGTRDGVLFPLLDGGLLFHKPPFLVPGNMLDGITTGERGGRYVDLVVSVQGNNNNGDNADDTLEFTNLQQDEVQGLQRFLALHAASNDHEDEEEDAVAAELDNNEDDNDEAQEAVAVSGRRTAKRKAFVDSLRINKRVLLTDPNAGKDDDEEEDEDAEYQGHHAVEEDESDDETDGEFNMEEGEDDEVTDDDEDNGDDQQDDVVAEADSDPVQMHEDDETESEG